MIDRKDAQRLIQLVARSLKYLHLERAHLLIRHDVDWVRSIPGSPSGESYFKVLNTTRNQLRLNLAEINRLNEIQRKLKKISKHDYGNPEDFL